jgi:hypothetical protein
MIARKTTIWGIAFTLALILWGCANIWRSPEFYPIADTCEPDNRILTMQEYGEFANTHPRPFIISSDDYLIFGSEHTDNPDDPQIKLIEEKWNEFKPSVVLVEGRLGFLIPGLMNPVKNYWEMGKVKELADEKKIDIYSWDTPNDVLLREKLNKGFTKEQVALSVILNSYFSNLRFGKPANPEKYVEGHFDRASIPELKGVITSIEQIDAFWKRDFPNEKDWRDTSDQWGLPGYLGEIADASNLIRNERLACAIYELLDKGERPFVIAGSSHAVCLKKLF